jgi:hypothetical protein
LKKEVRMGVRTTPGYMWVKERSGCWAENSWVLWEMFRGRGGRERERGTYFEHEIVVCGYGCKGVHGAVVFLEAEIVIVDL